jgi:chromosome segregation ATPase
MLIFLVIMIAVKPRVCQTRRYNARSAGGLVLESQHELRMGKIRERVKRAGTARLSSVEAERLYLLNEVDRLAAALVQIEREADKQVENQTRFLKGRVEILTAENRELRETLDNTIIERDAAQVQYDSLAQSVAGLINDSSDTMSDRMRLQAAMAHRVRQVEEACAQREEACAQAQRAADEQVAMADAAAEREKDIRRRVHERFKRVRRDAVQASYEIKRLRKELEVERDLGREARKFAALAYRVLEAEQEENPGKEPTWP